MGNKITEKYFKHANFAVHEKRALDEIITKTNFQPEKEIFRGQIYDKDKVGSLIYKGVWQDKQVALKIQGLQPDIDEIDMINRFNNQNESTRIRLPKLYNGSKCCEGSIVPKGYGAKLQTVVINFLLLMACIVAPQSRCGGNYGAVAVM